MNDIPNQLIRIDYKKCQPRKCDPDGECKAISACKHNVLRQEEPNDFPFLHPSRFCHGCALCARDCPFGAIEHIQTNR